MRSGSSTRLRAFFQRCHAQPPTASPRAVPIPRSAEGPHPDVQGGGGPQGDGGAVAGDGERLDEYPPSGDGLLHLEVDLVPPGLVVVGQGRLGDGADGSALTSWDTCPA